MKTKGFSLIELMTAMAIIAMLATISLPFYFAYARSSANKACLAEVKGYTMSVLVAIDNFPNNIPVPTESACSRIVNAAELTDLSMSSVIDAYPNSPGDIGTTCNLNSNTACVLDPDVEP